MKVKALILCILLLICNSVFAQEAIKIDEAENIPCDDLLGRMDNLNFELNQNLDSLGYILVYEGKLYRYNLKGKKYYVLPKVGESKSYINFIKLSIRFRNISTKRLMFVNAGFRENFTLEFWIVPNGATPPKATPTLTKMGHRKGKPNRNCGEF